MRALLLAVSLASACANYRHFEPRDRNNGEGPEGHPAAVYALKGEGIRGEVRVWSAGSVRRDDGGDGDSDCAVLHLGLELVNSGDRPLQIDLASLRCDELRTDDRVLGSLQPTRFAGQAEAAPGTTTRLDAWFEPGPGIGPTQIDAFEARFVVRCAEQAVCSQATQFVPYRPDLSRRGDDEGGGMFVGPSRGLRRCP